MPFQVQPYEPEPRGGWPCDRRDAHHSHPRTKAVVDCDNCKQRSLWDAVSTCEAHETCPGVGAHPNCMIGRA